jgi:hypothetical protein
MRPAYGSIRAAYVGEDVARVMTRRIREHTYSIRPAYVSIRAAYEGEDVRVITRMRLIGQLSSV